MKFIIAAFLLVAICQGMTVKSNPHFNKRKGYRNVNENPRQVTTPYSWKPATAYIMTKNSTSDTQWIKGQYTNIQEAFLFPGSHYLRDLIYDHFDKNWIMDVEDIKDYFEFPDCKMDDLKRTMYGVFEATEDHKGTALLCTRYVMKHVFHQKMKCPASIVDMYIVRMMYYGKYQLFYLQENNMRSVFTEMIPKISPELKPYTDDIAMRAVEMLEKTLFNKTMEFLVGFGLRDVAFTSHNLYEGLEEYFKLNTDKTSAYYAPSLLDTVRGYMWDIHCPGVEDMMDAHLDMIKLFREEFAMIESSKLCVELEDMLREYLDMMMPNMVHDLSGGNIWTLCTSVKDMVKDFMEAMDQYESVLMSRDMSKLEHLVRDKLGDAEWAILSEAVMRLGFYWNLTK